MKKHTGVWKWLSLPIAVNIGVFLFVVMSVYYFVFKNTHTNYSFVQSWEEYHSVEDWNLSLNAVADVDGDGEKDMVTFTNCAMLSLVPVDEIPEEKMCEEDGVPVITFSPVGQRLALPKPSSYNWIRKSYLVKTHVGSWKYYDMSGLNLRVYELGEDNFFEEINPNMLDRIDTFTYLLGHFGVGFLLWVLP